MTVNDHFLLRYVLPSALIAPLTLSGCSSQTRPNPGLEVFNQAITQPAIPDSIVREGDAVSYLVKRSVGPSVLTRFDISCAGNSGKMYYQTRNGLVSFSESKEGNYLPKKQFELLQQSDQFKAVCEQRAAPDWRVINGAEGTDWLLLDLNSVQTEDGVSKVWTGQHFAHQQFDHEGRHFFSQVRERLALRCDQRTLKVVSHFKLDAGNNVRNGWVRPEDELRAVSDAPLVKQQLFDVICEEKDAWAALPAFASRTSLPPLLNTPQASPEVLASIESLGLPEARLRLKKINFRYDAELFNGMKFKNRKAEHLISVDPASRQMLVQPIDIVADPKLQLTFIGLFDLASNAIDVKKGMEVSNHSRIIGVKFKGDWQSLPANSEVGYTLTRARDSESGSKSYETTVMCKIGNEISASRYNSALEGMVKPLNCVKMKTATFEWTEHFAYLSDYGIFVKTFENGIVGKWGWRIESIE